MTPALRSRCMLAGIGLAGASALGGCTRDADTPDAEALAQCHRDIQRASLVVQVGAPGMSPDDHQAARRQLSEAGTRLLHVWARREGLDISAADFADETPRAVSFLEGINAEAGLSEQETLSTRSAAVDAPGAWRDRVATALDCAGDLAG